MRRRALLASAAAAIAALALPASGAAAGSSFQGMTLISFAAPASNGYKLSFSAWEKSRGPREDASFSLRRGSRSVTYTVTGRGAIRGRRIEADFGALGSFSGTFTGKVKANDGGGCKPFLRKPTRFSGRLAVTGEHGFAAARLNEARGRIIALVKDPDCVVPTARPKPQVKPKQVTLEACPAEGTRFYAHLDRRRELASFQANTIERRGRLLIGRVAYRNARADAFDVDFDLGAATIAPGGPFSGSASFDGERLTGDLEVEQLGLTVPTSLTPAAAGIASGRDRPSC